LINQIYNKLLKFVKPLKAQEILSMITKHHRLQGSKGLWDSVKSIQEYLDSIGIESRIIRVESGAEKGHIVTPVSWDPIEASLEIKINDKLVAGFDLENHPTLLSAHSPGGEGCSELRVCGEKLCDDRAILVTGYLYDIYLRSDADLIIYYTSSRYHDAVPYTGLFLKPGDKKKSVVMNIPYSLATRIISKTISGKKQKIQVCWKAKVRYHNLGLPVLISCNGSDPGIVFISHICHPKPGAHDNASGSTANILIAETLSKKETNYSYCNVWVPEYTGTVFLDKYLPWRPLAVINLDMIGSKQYITNSTLTLVNPPRFMYSEIPAVTWISMQKVFDSVKSFSNIAQPGIRYGISPYTMGSDHDVFIGWAIDSVMYNEWPSKYYHTDKDTPETIDPKSVAYTSISAILAAELYFKKRDKIEEYRKLYENYVKTWYRSQAIRNEFSLSYLSRYLIKKPLITKLEEPLIETPLLGRKIYKIIGREEYLKTIKISGAYTYLAVYAFMAEKIGSKEHIKHYKAELLIPMKKKEEKQLKKVWEIIKSNIKI